MKIAIAGKGGTGKTTIIGTLARVLARRGRRVTAIDADSNPNLALTLGLSREQAAGLTPLPRTLLEEQIDAAGKKTMMLRMTPAEIARQYGIPTPDGVTMMLMGKVDHAGAG
ncbi:MAG: AAA family ATPase [Vicinamibacterales bacterium]